MPRFVVATVVVAVAVGASAAANGASSGDQRLRTCVDRWNQANMRGWGRAKVRVAVRRLDRDRLLPIGLRDPGRRRCVVSVALDRVGTFDCALNRFGAYNCPLRHEPMRPALHDANGSTDARGVLTLDRPLIGTHATPRLAWQRYPHTDGYVEPWTRAGTLRRGLRLEGASRGPCGAPSEVTAAKAAVRCRGPRDLIYDPCFPQGRGWRAGDVAACGGPPGDTTFLRWRISQRF